MNAIENVGHTLNFGDGSSTNLTGVSGSATRSHDYAYSPGGMTTYTVIFNVIGAGDLSCQDSVVVTINDTH